MLRLSTFGPVTRFDIARTLLGRGRYWTTAYLVDGLLIDSGCAHAAPALLSALQAQPPTRLVNTHSHEDHIGANGLLQQNIPGLEIMAHPLALPVLADPRHAQPLHPYRHLFWGQPAASHAQPLADGDLVRTQQYAFQVLFTPGHSPDHLCLYEADQGWLFSGDLFVGGQDRALRQDHRIWGSVASLQRVAGLPLRWIFPGCARVRENPTLEIERKIAYYQAQGAQARQLHAQGLGVDQIVRRLCGSPMWVEFVTLGHFSRRNLVRSYLSGGDA